MPSFKDSEGREHSFRVTTATLTRVREETGIKLGNITTDETVSQELADLETFVNVLYLVVSPDQAKCTAAQFGESLQGDVFDKAREALREALINFIPSSQRELLKRMFAAGTETEQAVLTKLDAIQTSGKLTEVINQKLDKALDEMLT